MTEVHELVRRLRGERRLSRNRHFDELSRPEARRARRVAAWLAGLERDLSEGVGVEVQPCDGGYRVRISFPALRARRETWITADEHALLLEGDVLARALGTPSPTPAEDALPAGVR